MRRASLPAILVVSALATTSLGCANLGLTYYDRKHVDAFKTSPYTHGPAVQCVDELARNRDQVVKTEGAKKTVTVAGASVTLLGGVAAAIFGSGQNAQVVQPPGDPPPPLTAEVDESAKTGAIVAASVTAIAGIATLIAGVIPPDQEGIARHKQREKHYLAAWDLHFDEPAALENQKKAAQALEEARTRDKEAKAAIVTAKELENKANAALETAKAAAAAAPQDAGLQAKAKEAKEVSDKAAEAAATATKEGENAAKAVKDRGADFEAANAIYERTAASVAKSFSRCVGNATETDLWPENRRKTLMTGTGGNR